MHRLLPTVLLAVSFGASADAIENHLPRISAQPPVPSAGQPFDLEVRGTWPDGCGADVRSQTVSGYDIRIVMEQPHDRICTQALVDYVLPLNPFPPGTVAKAGTYKVRYELVVPGQNQNRLLAFALVPVTSAATPDFRPEAGSWVAEPGGTFATSGSGVGFNLERQGDMVIAMTHFFDAGGKSEWLFGAGPYLARTARLDLTQVSGGQQRFGAYQPPQSYEQTGELLLEFHSPAAATAWFSEPEGPGVIDQLRLMPISVVPFSLLMQERSQFLAGGFVLSEAGSPTAERFKFEAIRFGAFHLIGAEDRERQVRVRCTIDTERPHTLPSQCVLERDGQDVATFDVVGNDQLIGNSRQGTQVILTRVD